MTTVTRTMLSAVIVLICLSLVPSPSPAWIVDGVPVCTAPANQYTPELATDGAGGAFYTWIDNRGAEFDIYCQRVDAQGAALWTTDGNAIATGDDGQTLPQIMADEAGGAFLTWQCIHDYQHDIHAQRVDADGNALWAAGGIVICDATEDQGWHALVPDGAGGMIIAWEDQRDDHNDIYAQRVDADGNTLWADDGVVIAAAESAQQSPRMVSDGAGGAIVVWSDGRHDDADVYAQRFDGNGNTLWTGDGVAVCTAEEEQRRPMIATDGQGGAIITWYDQRGLGDVYVYAQLIDSTGNALWAVDGVAIAPANNGQTNAYIVSDGDGGAIIAWKQDVPGEDTIYVQRIDADGTPLWTGSGVGIGGETGNTDHPQIIADGQGGAVVAWEDLRDGMWTDVYAQRLDATGTALWTSGGLAVCTALWDQSNIRLTRGADGHVILAWDDMRADGQLDIYTALVTADGVLVPTLLLGFDAWFDDDAITVEWRLGALNPDATFAVWRRVGETDAWERQAVRIERQGDTCSFQDRGLSPGRNHRYRVDAGPAGALAPLFETASIRVPAAPGGILTCFPNPFNPRAAIRFTLDRPQRVVLAVHDPAGRCLARLADLDCPAGVHELTWDGRDASGGQVPSGTYLLRLETEGRIVTRKAALVR